MDQAHSRTRAVMTSFSSFADGLRHLLLRASGSRRGSRTPAASGRRAPAILGLALATVLGTAACSPVPRLAGAGRGDGTLAVGIARMEITPDEPIRLTGYPNRAKVPAEGVEQALWAKAIAIGEERPAVLITTDLIGVPGELVDALAARLRSAGVDRAHLAVSATHTHTGPTLAGTLPYIFGEPVPPDQQAVIERYTAGLLAKLERVALAALADRRPARVSWARGRAGFAANRRVLKDGKWVGFGVDSAGAVDRDLPMLRVDGPDGRLRAVLLSYAAHATTLEGKHNFVHGDWPGAAQAMIEERHPGSTALVMIGTGADANPDPRGGGLDDVATNARAIADEVDRLLSAASRPITAAPEGRLRVIRLPFDRLPTRAELQSQAGQRDAYGLYARETLARLDRGEPLPTDVAYPIQSWSFGSDLAMVFLAGEVVADYGLRLKRELDASRLWVSAYTNDVAFYVASRRMIPEGGYEVDRSMVFYGQPARFAEPTEDLIVATVLDIVPRAYHSGPASR